MIVVDRPKLRFLLNGRQIQVDVKRDAYKKGRDYAVGTSHKRSVCRARILEVVEIETGWRLTIQREGGDEVRLMARSVSRGVVTAPVEADPDDPDVLRGGLRDEPELVDEGTQREFSATAFARDAERRRERVREREARPLHERVAELERLHEDGTVDVSRQLAPIRRAVGKANKRRAA